MFNHFNKISKEYFTYKNSISYQNIYSEISNQINPIIKNKNILDIGSGGNIFYNYNLANKLYALDISENMLKNLNNSKITKLIQDARDLSNIKKGSVDVVLMIFAIHHINGPDYKTTIRSLQKVLSEANKVINTKGEIIIVELTLNDFFYLLQRLIYKITFKILNIFKTDMVFFYSKKIIEEGINSIGIKTKVTVIDLKMSGWLDPFLGTFPGIIKIPAFMMPTQLRFFYLKKND